MAQNNGPEPTRLESADEILKALEARKTVARQKQAAGPAGAPAKAATSAQEPKRERPTQRPPMALLCALDDGPLDGKLDGEWFRLRADRTVIGRQHGDVLIPHDVQISSEHAEVVRERTSSGWRWLLRDLGSTNGTFVRIGGSVLRHDSELLVGKGRYRFESPGEAALPELTAGVTQAPLSLGDSLRGVVPSLVEITAAGPLQRTPLSLPEYWIGSDPRAAIVRGDDRFADAQHARLYRDKQGQWHVANNASLNGLWFRVKSMTLDKACQFRLGEQRFLFRVV